MDRLPSAPMSSNKRPNLEMKARFDSLDSLRAIACFLVIWQHVSESFVNVASGGTWTTTLANYTDFGLIGVISFFCISGFVIPHSFRGGRAEAVKAFLINRFFRLYPIYWISILPGILFTWYAWNKEITTELILKNITMAPHFFGSEPVMGLYWTLEVELVFYAVCAVFYLIFGNFKFPTTVTAFIVSFILYKINPLKGTVSHIPVLCYHLSIMFGVSSLRCIHEMHTVDKLKHSNAHRTICTLIGIAIAIVILQPIIIAINNSFTDSNLYWHKFGYAYLFGILLFLLFTTLNRTPSLLANIGRSTYSAYLFHAVVFNALLKIWLSADMPKARLEIFIAVVTVVTFAVAHASHKIFELPFYRMGKHTIRWVQNRSAAKLSKTTQR